MNEKEEKREFTQKLEQTEQSLTAEIEGKKNKAFILLGADGDEEAGNTQAIIAVGGKGQQIIEVLAQFISNPQTKPLLDQAIKLVMAKRLSGSLEKVIEALAKSE